MLVAICYNTDMLYYISDLHYFKEQAVNDRDKRGFESLEDMHSKMIDIWNSRVTDEDQVIVLGDLSNGTAQETNDLLKQLKGRISLIAGNNDRFLRDPEFDRSRLEWIDEYREMSDGENYVVLSHYPIMFYNKMFGGLLKGKNTTFMMYGHLHDSMDEEIIHRFQNDIRGTKRYIKRMGVEVQTPCHMINCFCKYSEYLPLTLEEWVENDRKRRCLVDQKNK